MVHIDDLYQAFVVYVQKQLFATRFLSDPDEYKRLMDESTKELQSFCRRNKLPVDFTVKKRQSL